MEDWAHEPLDGGGDDFGRGVVGGLDPLASSAVDGPGGGSGQEFWGGGGGGLIYSGMVAEAFEKHAADYRDNGFLHVRGKLDGGGAGGGGDLGQGLGEEVADSEDNACQGAAAGAVECDAALVEERMEAAGHHALEEGKLVGVVGVEGGAVDSGNVSDLLHGELVEVAGTEKGGEGLLEQLACAADARVGGFWRRRGVRY